MLERLCIISLDVIDCHFIVGSLHSNRIPEENGSCLFILVSTRGQCNLEL